MREIESVWMRTNELHASPKQITRSAGRSSVAAAAYRSASRLYDERTGLWHDYRAKGGVEFSRVYVPEGSPDWARDRKSLWNAAEVKENRNNSMTAREWEVAFPHEFNAMQRRDAGNSICRELVRRMGCAVDISYHLPDKDGDQRNFHAHILYTTRGFDEDTKDGWAKNKYRNLSLDAVLDAQGAKMRDENGKIITRSSQEVLELREFMAAEMNRIAQRDGLKVKTEHLSFEERGIEREPTQKLGPAAAEMERRGERSERGEENRKIIAANDNLAKLKEERKVIDLQIEREKRRIQQHEAEREEESNRLAEAKRRAAEQTHTRTQEDNQAHFEQKRDRDYDYDADEQAAITLKIEREKALEAKRQTAKEKRLKEARIPILRAGKERRRALKAEQQRQTDALVKRLRETDTPKEAAHRAYWQKIIRDDLDRMADIEDRLNRKGIGGMIYRTLHGKEAREEIEALGKNIENAQERLAEGVGGLSRGDYQRIQTLKLLHAQQRQELEDKIDEQLAVAEAKAEMSDKAQARHVRGEKPAYHVERFSSRAARESEVQKEAEREERAAVMSAKLNAQFEARKGSVEIEQPNAAMEQDNAPRLSVEEFEDGKAQDHGRDQADDMDLSR